MKKILLFLGCLILSASLFAEQPLIRFYMLDGSVNEFDLEDIEKITHISRSDDMIMEVYQQGGVEYVYPAMSVSRLSFTTDSLDTKMFTAHIYDQPRHFAVTSIDSIVFSRLEPKVAENITVVDSLSQADIISVDENTITFRAGSSLASAITTDWFVVSAPTPQTPDGFLRKVTGLNTQGNQLIATTEDGDLFEVIEDGVISFQVTYSEEDMVKMINESGGKMNMSPDKAISFKYTHDIVDGFKLEGELAVSNVFTNNFVMKRRILHHSLIRHEITMVYKLKAEAALEKDVIEESVSINELLGIPQFKLTPQVVWIYAIPVVITSYIDLQAGFKLAIHAKVSTNISHVTNAIVGLEYNLSKEPDGWENLSTATMKPGFSPPTLSLGGTVKVYSGPQINQGFYGLHKLFNAYAGVFGFCELEVELLRKPFWKLYAGVETGAGAKSKWYKKEASFPYSIESKTLLRQAADLIDAVIPAEAAMGDTIKIVGQGFGSMEKSYVGFKHGPSLLEEDVLRVSQYISWKDDEIAFVMPPGLPTPTGQDKLEVEVLVNTKGFWTDIVPFTLLLGPSIESMTPDTVRIGKPLVIRGKRFGDTRKTSEVSFDGILVEEYEAWSDTEITVKVPEGIDDGLLTVKVEDRISNEVPYVVAKPFITSIDPNEVFPRDEMVITGKYFDDLQNESFVSFGGVVATNYIEWSDKQIVLKVPEDIESGVLWVEVAGKKSNEKAFVVKEVEVSILPPRIVIYEMLMGATEVEHEFEAYAKPDSVYRFSWNFDDGNTFSEVVQKGETSKVSNRYMDVKDGDTFYPSVELYDLDGKLLAMDDITINITAEADEITVGNLVWMTKNLDVDVGNNWYPQGSYCKTFGKNGTCSEYYWKEHTEYGRLYDWESAIAACESIGWRLPGDDDWQQLIDHWGGYSVACGKLKSTRTNSKVQMGYYTYGNPDGHPFWYEPNTGATNESGFSALPGGVRGTGGSIGVNGYWWSSTESSPSGAYYRVMFGNGGTVNRYGNNKTNGLSVRCVRYVD